MQLIEKHCRLHRFAVSLLVLLMAAFTAGDTWGNEQPVEVRAVWLHPGWDWRGDTASERRDKMLADLDRLQRANINLLLPWVESKHALQLLGDPEYQSDDSVSYGGVAFFKGSAFTPQLVEALRSGPFRSPARLPWQVAR